MEKDYIYIGSIAILSIATIILTIIIINYRKKIKIYINKKESIEEQYYMQVKHYESYTNNYNKYRKFKHDIKNNIIILDILMNKKEYGKAQDYLDTIKEELENINIINYTSNVMLDSILYNINEICKIKSIDFKVKANINNGNSKLQDFIEFLTYSLYEFIEIVEKEDYKKEIICNIKENEKNLILYLETTSINNYNKLLINETKNKLKRKAENLNFTIELKEDNNLILKCLL